MSEGYKELKADLKEQKTDIFTLRIKQVALFLTTTLAGASATFILVNVFLFSYEAFQFGRIQNL